MMMEWTTLLVIFFTTIPISTGTQGQGFRDDWRNVLSQQIREFVESSSSLNITASVNGSTTDQNSTSDTSGGSDGSRVTSPETDSPQITSNRFPVDALGVDLVPRTSTTTISQTGGTTVSDIVERDGSTRIESSPVAHVPNGEVLEAIRPLSDASAQLDDSLDSEKGSNPSIRQMEEPIAPPSAEESRERGSLPLVLGAAIVVIFGLGVAGATITAACRKRKLKKMDDIENTSSGDINNMSSKNNSIRSGINPVFTVPDKQRNSLALALSTFPPNSSMYKDIKCASPTAAPY